MQLKKNLARSVLNPTSRDHKWNCRPNGVGFHATLVINPLRKPTFSTKKLGNVLTNEKNPLITPQLKLHLVLAIR
jgi:hypothetical protein